MYIGFRGSGLGSRVYRVYSSLAAVRWRLPKAVRNFRTSIVGALIMRGILYYTYNNRNPLNSIGNYSGLYSIQSHVIAWAWSEGTGSLPYKTDCNTKPLEPKTLGIKIAQKPYIAWFLGPKACKFELLAPYGGPGAGQNLNS